MAGAITAKLMYTDTNFIPYSVFSSSLLCPLDALSTAQPEAKLINSPSSGPLLVKF